MINGMLQNLNILLICSGANEDGRMVYVKTVKNNKIVVFISSNSHMTPTIRVGLCFDNLPSLKLDLHDLLGILGGDFNAVWNQ